ncbi:hypothetical protein HAX54_018618, partial [Datura stramonium]|nr:hypothetical protein [Datura stramonium]
MEKSGKSIPKIIILDETSKESRRELQAIGCELTESWLKFEPWGPLSPIHKASGSSCTLPLRLWSPVEP